VTGFHDRILAASPGDELLAVWRRKLTAWDFEQSPTWSATAPRSPERRAEVYDKLAFGADLRKALDAAVPVHVEPGPRHHQPRVPALVHPGTRGEPLLLLGFVRAAAALQGLERRGGLRLGRGRPCGRRTTCRPHP
jgi:hypothetical protein